MSALPTVAVVVLAYGEEPTLERCITALQASTGVTAGIVVVDNGADPSVLAAIDSRPGVRVIGPPENRGFAGGCNFGAAHAHGDFVALVNSDAFVHDTALQELVNVAARPSVGIASASVRLADEPELLNSAGNPIHFSGLSWAGAFREPASDHAQECDIASACGAAMVLRRDVWERLGGFDINMFAYLEDTELSMRCWQHDLAVRFVPAAVVEHDYAFGRHSFKMYLLERNRLLILATVYSARTLIVLAPILLLFELMMVVQALVGGWIRPKLRGWWWMARNIRQVLLRRHLVRESVVVPDGAWMFRLVGKVEPTNVDLPPGMQLVNTVLNSYWLIARRLLRGAGRYGPDLASSAAERMKTVK